MIHQYSFSGFTGKPALAPMRAPVSGFATKPLVGPPAGAVPDAGTRFEMGNKTSNWHSEVTDLFVQAAWFFQMNCW